MSLYVSEKVGNEIVLKKYAPAVPVYRGFWAVTIGGFAGTLVECNGSMRYIGSNEKTIYQIVEPGTYTFTATRHGETKSKTIVLDDKDPNNSYTVNLGLYIGMQQLEYIESTGTQWIDTGVVYSSANHKSVVKFSHVSSGSDNAPWWVWGSDSVLTTKGSRSGSVALKSDNNTLGIGVGEVTGGGSPYTISNPTVPITVDVETKDNNTFSVSVNGLSIYDNISFNGSCYGTSSEVLFGINVNGTIQQKTSTKIYAAQFYDNGILVRDFIPVKDDTGRGALYDKVTQQIFYNSGEGEFRPGIDYLELEYIQNSGSQKIDTGVTINASKRFEIDVQLSSDNPNENSIMGTGGGSDTNFVSIRAGNYFGAESGLQNHFGFIKNQKYYFPGKITKDTNRHLFVIDLRNNKVKIDQYEETTDGTTNSSLTWWIGSYMGSTSSGFDWIGKYYGVKIYNNEELIHDLIPVQRISDNKVCFYDTVNAEFFENSGTEDWIPGPVK